MRDNTNENLKVRFISLFSEVMRLSGHWTPVWWTPGRSTAVGNIWTGWQGGAKYISFGFRSTVILRKIAEHINWPDAARSSISSSNYSVLGSLWWSESWWLMTRSRTIKLFDEFFSIRVVPLRALVQLRSGAKRRTWSGHGWIEGALHDCWKSTEACLVRNAVVGVVTDYKCPRETHIRRTCLALCQRRKRHLGA